MKKLYLNTGGFDSIFNELQENLGGELVHKANEYKLSFKSKWAVGTITGSRFEKEMTYLHFDLMFYKDVNLSVESNPFAPVFFAYCKKGRLTHSFGINGETKILKAKQSGIMSNTSAINSVLYFESHKQIQFSLIGVPTFVNAKNENFDFVSGLRKKFINESGNYLHIGVENFKISEKLHELTTIPQKGTVRCLLMKSILREILELEIAQHSYNYISTFDPLLDLAVRQINEIKRISNMNFLEVVNAFGSLSRTFLPRSLKEKYHLSYKSYNQKLAS